MSTVKIAGVQTHVHFADVTANVEQTLAQMQETKQAGAYLTVFPECSLTGYCFETSEEAEAAGISLQSPAIQSLVKAAKKLDLYTIVGFAEWDGERLHNTVACLGPTGIVGCYRKIHLPYLGLDRFTSPGTKLEVLELPKLKVGMNICYDCSFPEACRVLMLEGADLVVYPTNWPPTSGLTAEVIPNARALENHLYVMSVNRVGTERGFQFIGKSRICDPRGATVTQAAGDEPVILYAEIDPQWARRKHLVNIPGVHEVHRVNDRRPKSYAKIVQSEPPIG
jgi:predicted amidohydrolase